MFLHISLCTLFICVSVYMCMCVCVKDVAVEILAVNGVQRAADEAKLGLARACVCVARASRRAVVSCVGNYQGAISSAQAFGQVMQRSAKVRPRQPATVKPAAADHSTGRAAVESRAKLRGSHVHFRRLAGEAAASPGLHGGACAASGLLRARCSSRRRGP